MFLHVHLLRDIWVVSLFSVLFFYPSKAAINLPVQPLCGYIRALLQGEILKIYSRAKV